MASAREAAKLLIQFGILQSESDSGDGVTNLRLNKLLYFAQGYSLARFGKPLFEDKIEAWDLGPVVPGIYRAYKKFGKNILTDSAPDRASFSDIDYTVLFDTYNAAKKISTFGLVDMTHEQGTPWRKVHDSNANGVISIEEMRQYFTDNPFCKISFQDAVAKLKEKAYTPKRDENGVAIIPKEIANGWTA